MAHRTVIAGGSRVGKTTLSLRLATESGLIARSTDELIGKFSFQDAPTEVVKWLDGPSYIVEGVHTVRALRLWLAEHDDGLPFDRLFWGQEAKVARTPGQESCAKGINTVWQQIESKLL